MQVPFALVLIQMSLSGTMTDLSEFIRNDDGSSPDGYDDPSLIGAVPLGFKINFFGEDFDQVFVNNNGNLTFGESLSEYTPKPLDSAGLKIIAPFWADVDTRISGTTTYGQGTIDGRAAFGATWKDVGYFREHADKLNTFQVILIDRSSDEDKKVGDFDIEFNYEKIKWETGDNADVEPEEQSGGENGFGGKSAHAGYSNGSDVTKTLEGSGIPGALLDGGTNALISTTHYLVGSRDGGLPKLIKSKISLIPNPVTNPSDTSRTVIAKVEDEVPNPLSGQLVTFEIIEGPNKGLIETYTTDVNGEASFTYTVNGCMGDDQIQASFNNSDSINQVSNEVNFNIPSFPPIANFLIPSSGYVPLTVNLDGSSSVSACDVGSIVDYQWQSSDGQPISPGVNSSITYTQPGDYQITLTVTDNLGGIHSTQQPVKILISNQDALIVFLQGLGAEPISIDNRSISVVIAGETHRSLLAEQVTQGTSLSNNLIVEPIGDLNNDGIEDFLFTYPSGDQQVFYYFGTSNEPSQEALKRYFETIGAEAVVINADNSLYLILDGITYQGQLADEIVAGTPPSDGFLFTTNVGDVDGDGVDDFEITYPNGDRQILHYFTSPPPPKLAVLRGQVTERDDQPLSEVTITLFNRSDKTRTLSDGTFSLAVNGGELFTLKYSKAGYLSVQRQVRTETQGFFWAEDVVMTPIEQSQGTTIDLSATNTEPMQVVQGPPVVTKEDELNPELKRPPRQATLFFPQGTTTLADTQLDELEVSITEYTVDDDDLAAMPVPLPPGSGYTYAVNISANGETDVPLSQPIPFYVNNFLGFDTGTIVPLGQLDDTDQSRWVPETDGRVIKILKIIDEGDECTEDDECIEGNKCIACLDTTGDRAADNGSDLGITEEERKAIAIQFPEGGKVPLKSGEKAGHFWRVVINKLGTFDLNWPLRIPDELNIEEKGKITSTASKIQDVDENPCVKKGCIIEAERQVLGETIPVVGVPFNLNYRSSRTSGRNVNYKLDIPLQDNTVKTPNLKRILLEVTIGGHKISEVFSDVSDDNPAGPLNTPRYTDEWNIKESYGGSLHGQGNHKATVRIGYVYDGVYEVPPDITQSLTDVQCSTNSDEPISSDEPIGSFGCIKTTEITEAETYPSIPARQEVTDRQEYTVNIGGWFPRSTGLGEWTIDVHHAYAPNDEVLYLGNGGLRQVAPIKQNGKILISSEDGGLVYEFSETGSHLRTIDSLTNQTIYTFSYLNGYLVEIEDIDGDITTIDRNADNAPLAIVAPYGQRTELALNANGYLASVKNPAAEVHQMVYTDDGLLTQFTNPRNHVANYKYNDLGLLVEDTNFVGGGWKLARTEESEINGYLVTMTSKEGRVSRFNVATLDDGTFQRVTSAPDGTKTTVTREIEDNNKLSISERSDGTKITLEEGPESGRFGMQAPLATNLKVETPKGLVSTISTERIPKLAEENNPLSLQKLTETVTVNGRTSSSVYDVSKKKITATSAADRKSVSYLDDKGRVIRKHIPNLADVHSSYDERGRLIETRVGDGLDARTATISYDDNGYISEVTDAMERTVSFTYDAVGRVETQTLVDGRKIQYSYDANGNVTSITPPGRPAHDFSYTPMDLQSQYTPPALADVSEPQTEYEYNLDKQLIGITRPDGRVVTFDYDAEKGRLNAITLPNRQLNYHYDADTGECDLDLMYSFEIEYDSNHSMLKRSSCQLPLFRL
jgi:YD repeat-containing protein